MMMEQLSLESLWSLCRNVGDLNTKLSALIDFDLKLPGIFNSRPEKNIEIPILDLKSSQNPKLDFETPRNP